MLRCARICGIPNPIIERAYEIMRFEENIRYEESIDDELANHAVSNIVIIRININF